MNELRREPLLGRWILVSSESLPPERYDCCVHPQEEKDCILCNPAAEVERYVHNNVKVIEAPESYFVLSREMGRKAVGLYDRMNSVGLTEIVIDSPEHTRPAEELPEQHMIDLIEVYYNRLREMEEDSRIRCVLIHKNYGQPSGDIFGHPHTIITATSVIPKRVKDELDGAKNYYEYKERCVICDILNEELRSGERIVMESPYFVVFTPYATRFPFEFWIVPRKHNCSFKDTSTEERADLGIIMKKMLLALKKVLNSPPYNYVLHTAPSRIPRMAQWHTLGEDFHWHIEVMPRIRMLSGFELGSGMYILTTSPEDAAKYLKKEVEDGD